MKFEEEFPDLRDKVKEIKTYSYNDPHNIDFDKVVLIEDIQKHCIDKKRVAEIIDKIDKDFRDDIKEKAKSGDFVINTMLVGANLHITKQLKKELKLE